MPNKEKGCVLWLTGLSGSGKSTTAEALDKKLRELGQLSYVLDGDIVRQGLCSDLGFTESDREENIRRIGEVSRLFADAGALAVTAFISPYREHRDRVRARIAPGRFVEVFVGTPLDVCESRDPKGLYKKARAGQLDNFTGVSAPYEAPLNPELSLDTVNNTVEDSVEEIVSYLRENNLLGWKQPLLKAGNHDD